MGRIEKKMYFVAFAVLCAIFPISYAGLVEETGEEGEDTDADLAELLGLDLGVDLGTGLDAGIDDGEAIEPGLTVDLVDTLKVGTEKDLVQYLFSDYRYCKDARPVKESAEVVKVEVELSPLEFTQVDDEQHVLTLTTFLKLRWTDEYLQWDPLDYGGLDHLILDSSVVWLPAPGILAATPDDATFPKTESDIIVDCDGSVLWAVPFTFSVRCPELTTDALHANCYFPLMSWYYDTNQVTFSFFGPIDTSGFKDSYPGWHLAAISRHMDLKFFPLHTDRAYSAITYKFTLLRKF